MVDLSSLYGGYQRATRYSRIKSTDLSKVFKPYGIKMGSARKSTGSDAAVRHRAARAVVKRYLRIQKK